ncbi:iron-containing alcohol dehydrogenase [Rathayibacter sp. VKM Ac-2856]|uniref:iron-containing alcohol dehydrogenase n=1 Tax=unclassified Rathayibacter TaxID=2609250 RepID=UPI0015637A6E|nr:MULTISPECIES: iron-containing alcohol dehydrogenase [unclassified Rathayibacter]NQX04199.1 iron-containing alcohol dehydrogenase [Rathayibacter sp. VKM Ac-2858]NQX19368.1 iron-containing alcohol dehydrogenase [Rathayibacter sp. VKM Ac-2856]
MSGLSTDLRTGLDADAATSGARRTLVVLDSALLRNGLVDPESLPGTLAVLDVTEEQGALLDRVDRALRAVRPDRLVGIGGGRLHDIAALARLFAADRAHRPRIDTLLGRHGGLLAPVPPASARLPRLVLVPSTIGPGSETSAAACREIDGLRSVVVGDALRADAALLDADLTATLPRSSVLEGAAEAALRLIGSRSGSPADRSADAPARRLLESLADAGGRVAGGTGVVHRADRAALGSASAASHDVLRSATADPFAATHWYLANEVSSRAGLRKVPATMPLLPVLWSRDSAERRARRRVVWHWFAAPLELHPDPVVGSAQWSERWGIAVPAVEDRALLDAAPAIVARWGRSALPGLAIDDALRLLRAAFRPRRSTERMREVNT